MFLFFDKICERFCFSRGLYPVNIYSNNWCPWLYFCFTVLCFWFLRLPCCFIYFLPVYYMRRALLLYAMIWKLNFLNIPVLFVFKFSKTYVNLLLLIWELNKYTKMFLSYAGGKYISDFSTPHPFLFSCEITLEI